MWPDGEPTRSEQAIAIRLTCWEADRDSTPIVVGTVSRSMEGLPGLIHRGNSDPSGRRRSRCRPVTTGIVP